MMQRWRKHLNLSYRSTVLLAIVLPIFMMMLMAFAALIFLIAPESTITDSQDIDVNVNVDENIDGPIVNPDISTNERLIIPSPTLNLMPWLLLSGVVAIATAVFMSSRLSQPVTRMADAAKAIGDHQLDHRVPVRGSREMRQLATAFNQMATDLQQAEIQRRQLMADVSHELRTPLTALEGNLRAALDGVYQLTEEEIAHLYGQTRYLIHLVNDLHELSLAEAQQLPLNLQKTDILQLLQETVAIFVPLAEEQNIHLTTEWPNHLPLLLIDDLRIRQVLHNLLANALRHTPANGRIHLQARQQSETMHITITDSGEGIAPDHLPFVFDRFYRIDQSRTRETGGAGLGLAIVKAIVQAHNGRIWVTSQGVEQGTQFTIALLTNQP